MRYDDPAGFGFQAEYYDGEILGEDYTGWYAMAENRLPKQPWTIFYRFDTSDRASKAFEYERHTGGLAWGVSKNERITLQAEAIAGYDYKDNAVTNFAMQYQIKY